MARSASASRLLVTVVLCILFAPRISATTLSRIGDPFDCTSCYPPNFVAYNRCTYLDIDNQISPCCLPTNGNFRLDAKTKKVSYRFTLSPSFVGDQTPFAAWIYYRKVGGPGRYVATVYSDSAGVPGSPIGSSTTFSPIPSGTGTGTPVWQKITLSAGPLHPGSVYHLVLNADDVAPDPGASNYVELISAMGRVPVPFMPTDATLTSQVSPCDRWFSLMFSDSTLGLGTPATADYFLTQVGPGGFWYSPIFALEFPSSLFGQPYNQQLEEIVVDNDRYGQAIVLSQPTTVNHVAFWVRAVGCAGTTCPPPGADALERDTLEVDIVPDGSTLALVSATIAPEPYNHNPPHITPGRFGRSHWMGTYFPTQTLAAGKYYLVLRSNIVPNAPDGWVFTAQRSTLPSTLPLPTYGGANSYAVRWESATQQYVPLSTIGDTDAGFILAYMPDYVPGSNEQAISSPCDHGITNVTCPNGVNAGYCKVAAENDQLVIGYSNENTGGMSPVPQTQYIRLMDDTGCTPLSNAMDCVGPQVENTHDSSQPGIQWTMGPGNAFLWVEFGHHGAGGSLVRDQLLPIEIRHKDTCP